MVPRDAGGYCDALLQEVVYRDFVPPFWFKFGFLTEAEFFFSFGSELSAFLGALVDAVVFV